MEKYFQEELKFLKSLKSNENQDLLLKKYD